MECWQISTNQWKGYKGGMDVWSVLGALSLDIQIVSEENDKADTRISRGLCRKGNVRDKNANKTEGKKIEKIEGTRPTNFRPQAGRSGIGFCRVLRFSKSWVSFYFPSCL